ncbi:MAG: hypothetical protein K6A36_00230 [Paludibacteraceae bacterium]|nr:hypothetical protein [Paludibacteraceae bacterium]
MKKKQINMFFLAFCVAIGMISCSINEPTWPGMPDCRMIQIDSLGWFWEEECPRNIDAAALSVQTDKIRLHFYGWEADEDSLFTVSFPTNTDQYGRVLLEYKMCGWNAGPAEWDMTTMIKIHDKANDQWLEFVRAITPYGGSFGANWEKIFYIDVTEFLPLLKGDTEFRIFYCGWDATDKRAHAVQLTYLFFEGQNPYGKPCGQQKIYDSTLPNDGGNGYRAWSYGVKGWPIEDDSRLGKRTINAPAGTKRILVRVCITGHGQDAYNGDGKFPNRTNTYSESCAEFDHNWYDVVLNGDTMVQRGDIWEINTGVNNYKQAGTYRYNRAGWGPGKPCNIHHWIIRDIRTGGEKLTLDLNLDEYISPCTKPNDDKVACYYVMADAFFFK